MELLAILEIANKAGFQVGALMGVVAIWFMISKTQNKNNNTLTKIFTEQVDKIVKAIEGHNHRLDEHDNKIEVIHSKVAGIEDDMISVKKKLEVDFKKQT